MGGAVLTAAVLAAGLATRLRLPALVLFAALGMLVGTDGAGWIAFDDYRMARLIGTVALVVILFEGGLAAGWRQLRPVLGPAVSLAVIGTVVTALIVGLAAAALFEFSLLEGLLLGAILAATDGAAVFALMRGVRLPVRLRRTLEGESGLNDPIAVLLVLVAINLITKPQYGAGTAILFFVREITIGVAVGAAGGLIAAQGARRVHHLPSGLLHVGSLAGAALAYGTAGALGGSGFLAVYLVGLGLGHAQLAERESVVGFHRGLAMLAEIGMFFALGLLVFPSQFATVAVKAMLLALITVLLARPVASTLATARQGFSRPERTLLAWAGLRGAVPVILATFAVIEGVPRSIEILNIVFFAVLVSAALQGPTVHALAARMWADRSGLTAPPESRSGQPADGPLGRAPDASGPRHPRTLDGLDLCLQVVGDGKNGGERR
jgi:potassium/hydrogen antiporter